jgi:hypothetical protein
VHTVIDDHSRVAYAEIHDDETATTAAAVLQRAVSWFAVRGVTVERVLSDNGSAYKSHLWRDTCQELNIKVKKTRPYRLQLIQPWRDARGGCRKPPGSPSRSQLYITCVTGIRSQAAASRSENHTPDRSVPTA